jgi:ABC-type Na+ transport system ATPase subunit NatA
MQVAAEREIARYLGAVVTPPASGFGAAVTPAAARATIPTWDINLAEFPHPAESSFSLVGVIAPTFLLAAAMFVFTIQIFNVVLERELKLRSSMRVMGVSDGVWWLSWILWELCVTNVISALLICAFGNAFPFDLFRRNQFSVVFIHFWLFEGSLTALGYFLSTFLGKANGSTFVGFTIFLFGFIFQLVVTLGGVPFTTAYGIEAYGRVSGYGQYRPLQVIFSLFPPTVFAKGISDLGIATASDSLSGIKWRTRDSYCYCNPDWIKDYAVGAGAPPAPLDFKYIYEEKPVSRLDHVCSAADYKDYRTMFPAGTCDYSIQECWQWMVFDTFFFLALTFLFDQFNANEFGVRSFRIRNGWSVGSLAFFIVTLGVLLGVAGEPTGAIVAAMIIIFVDVYSVLAVLEKASYNRWVVAVAVASHVGLFFGGLFVSLVFAVKTCIMPEFKTRHAGIARFMFFPAWFVMAVYWLVQDMLGACGCCAVREESRFSLEQVEAAGLAAGGALPAGLDDDVAAEEDEIKGRLRSGDETLEPNVAVEVRGLVRSFGSFHAVRGNFFRVETGKLFALLGPNGAGKTTTINLLTGVLPITAGDASVCGHSLVGGGMSAIRGLMGVCPQFDILWAELTATEHLRLFAALKGLPRAEWGNTTVELLERTKLTPAGDRRSSTYSGGMKRRLSVAVALIGDPEVVYLDEPTTGMDPITRRYVWDIILEAKQGRAIVLTTHSMVRGAAALRYAAQCGHAC